ncbi:MAG TPA: DUF3341 domain-containing protein [Stellaceae bacterium]|nr:DUF3341 domain-containing protein [Stellaceae bacterium]
MSDEQLHGVMAEFRDSGDIVAAARRLHLNGFRRIEAYSPFPLEELDRELNPGRRPWVPILIFLGGLVGACYSYFLQYWAAVINYPINVGGRPYNSWPAFTVSSFEVTVLFAVATAFFGFLLFCRLPLLYHPAFNAPDFDRASQDRYFLCVESRDPRFDADRLRELFQHYGAVRISMVPT